jgi:uncharacterized protein (TIGR04551 family)
LLLASVLGLGAFSLAGREAAAQPAPEPPPSEDSLVPPAPEPSPAPAPAKPPAAPAKPPAAPAKPPAAPAEGAPTAASSAAVAATEPEKPAPVEKGSGTEIDSHVFAEDWWTTARPVFELHGYYRVRAEFFSHFALGRKDSPADAMWPQPGDNDYFDIKGVRNRVILCGDNPQSPEPCVNNVQAGANMRFRINPELHVSDNVRVMAQVDMLDNVMLGSTPEGYANEPNGGTGGYRVRERGGYAPLGAFSTTQWSPTAGQNSLTDSIAVKRVWGEYMTPVGLLRFGRMGNHWGLGMLINGGDGYDSDWGGHADRIMFVTGIKKWDLYFAGMWDFVNEGPTSALINERQGQLYDLTQSDDVDQWGFVIARRRNPQQQRLELARGDVVLNGGMFAVYRSQKLALDRGGELGATGGTIASQFDRRGAEAFIPDFWFQLLYKKFRFEAEAAVIWGSMEDTDSRPESSNYVNADGSGNDGWTVRQFGFTTQTEIRAVEDKLRIQFGTGYATGDPDVEGLSPPDQGLDLQLTRDRNFSTFRFHPDYRIDLILWRNILQRVQGAYYFRPSVEYDFNREQNGQRIGGGAAVIWSRASEFVQTPGNARDLGVELDFKLYYQAKDGSLNDDATKMGGFYTQLEYGVMFPLGGLGYLPQQEADLTDAGGDPSLSTAQILRWYLGIMF